MAEEDRWKEKQWAVGVGEQVGEAVASFISLSIWNFKGILVSCRFPSGSSAYF